MRENQNIEFKRTWRDEYLQYISGFANSQGGTLYIGKDDDGQVCGVSHAEKLLEDLPNQINQTTGVLALVNLHTEGDKDYISIKVEPTDQPISYRGKFYYRTGSTLQEVKGSDLRNLMLKKMGRQWDDLPCEGAKIEDIDPKAVEYFLRRAIPIGRVSQEATEDPIEIVLKNLNLITDDGQLKNAAILLFGKSPQRRFLGARFRIGRFVKNETDLIHHDIVDGSLIQMADKVMWKLSQDYLIRPIHYEGLRRMEPLEMPEDALRELVFNAIIHRDYLGDDTQMKIYNDRIWFWNDGNLPEGFSVERMQREHMSVLRNRLIADIFYRAGFIETWGRGVSTVCQAFRQAGLKEPTFENLMSGTLVTIPRDLSIYGFPTEQPEPKTDNKEHQLTDRQKKIIELIKDNQKITLKELSMHVETSIPTISRELTVLQEKGILFRTTNNRFGKWIIKKL